jgi:hypothetical protein
LANKETGLKNLRHLICQHVSQNDDVSAANREQMTLFAYLFSYFTSFAPSVQSFQHVATGEKSDGKLRGLWIDRMEEVSYQLMAAATDWAGLRDPAEFQLYWIGDTPPNVFSLVHIAAQSFVETVPPALEC